MSPSDERLKISVAQKKAIRAFYRSQGLKIGHKHVRTWFKEQYNIELPFSTISNILSSKFDHLDFLGTDYDESKRCRPPKYPDLEVALAEVLLKSRACGFEVSGSMLVEVANIVWTKIPAYQNIQCPSFSGGWSEKFKVRHKIKTRSVIGNAASFYPSISSATVPPALSYQVGSGSHSLNPYMSGSFNTQLVYNQAYSMAPLSTPYQDQRGLSKRSASFSSPSLQQLHQNENFSSSYILPDGLMRQPNHHVRSFSTSFQSGMPFNQQQSLSASKVADTKQSFNQLLNTIASYSPNDVFTMNETILSYRAAPTPHDIKKATSSRKSFETVSVALCYNASGSERLIPWVIGHVSNPSSLQIASFTNTLDESRPVANSAAHAVPLGHPLGIGTGFSTYDSVEGTQYSANSIGWMGMADFRSWLRWLDSQMEGRSVLLILDPFKAHEVGYQSMIPMLRNVSVEFLPGYLSNRYLPPDLGAIYNFKAEYRHTLLKYLTLASENKWNEAADLLPAGYSKGPVSGAVADEAVRIFNACSADENLPPTIPHDLSGPDDYLPIGSPQAVLNSINLHIALYWIASAWKNVPKPLLQDSWTRSGLLPQKYQLQQPDYTYLEVTDNALANISGAPITSVPVNVPASGPTYVPQSTLDGITSMTQNLQSTLAPELFAPQMSVDEFGLSTTYASLPADLYVAPVEEYFQEYPSEFIDIATAPFQTPVSPNEHLARAAAVTGPIPLSLALRAIDSLLQTSNSSPHESQLQQLKNMYEGQYGEAKKKFLDAQRHLESVMYPHRKPSVPSGSQSSRGMFEWPGSTFKSPTSPHNTSYPGSFFPPNSPKRRRTSSHSSTISSGSSSSFSYPLSTSSSSTDSFVHGSSFTSLSGISNSAFSSAYPPTSSSSNQRRRQSSSVSDASMKSPNLMNSPSISANIPNSQSVNYMSRHSSFSGQNTALSPISGHAAMLPMPNSRVGNSSNSNGSNSSNNGSSSNNNGMMMAPNSNEMNPTTLQFALNPLNFNIVSQSNANTGNSYGLNHGTESNQIPGTSNNNGNNSNGANTTGPNNGGIPLSPLTMTNGGSNGNTNSSIPPFSSKYSNQFNYQSSTSSSSLLNRRHSTNPLGSGGGYSTNGYNNSNTNNGSNNNGVGNGNGQYGYRHNNSVSGVSSGYGNSGVGSSAGSGYSFRNNSTGSATYATNSYGGGGGYPSLSSNYIHFNNLNTLNNLGSLSNLNSMNSLLNPLKYESPSAGSPPLQSSIHNPSSSSAASSGAGVSAISSSGAGELAGMSQEIPTNSSLSNQLSTDASNTPATTIANVLETGLGSTNNNNSNGHPHQQPAATSVSSNNAATATGNNIGLADASWYR